MPRPKTGPLGTKTKPFVEENGFHTSSINVGIMGTRVHSYWTNFSRQRPTDFEILEEDPKIPGYWRFQTNLEKDDFDFMLSPTEVRTFLYQMADIYRSPETG